MNYKKYYKDKIARRGNSIYERNYKQKQREFDLYFRDTLNSSYCLIDGEESKLVFQDHSQSNNKDLSDDKYIIAENKTNIHVGSYVDWDDSQWLVFTEEHKTIKTHQQLKVKIVNESIKWIKDGVISNNGNGWGAYVQSQTLYTLGVTVSANLSTVDSKMMMYMQNNEETRKLKTNDRLFVGLKVYKIKMIDFVSRPGLINYLMEEDTLNEAYDNPALRIADYYRKFENNENEKPETKIEIIGESAPRVSKTYTYNLSDEAVVSEWILEFLGSDKTFAYITSKSEDSMTLQIKNDARYIGETVNLIAKLSNDEYIMKTLNIIKRF